jgi:ribosomal protein L37E
MKCRRCNDYNRNVAQGVCSKCQFNRFDYEMVSEMCNPNKTSTIICPDAVDLEFEEYIQRSKWDDITLRKAASNTDKIHHLIQQLFGGGAMVHKEGSVRKHTDTRTSDVDLMITLKGRRQMTSCERDLLMHGLQFLTDDSTGDSVFQQVEVGCRAIKVTPTTGPSIDIVAHHSNFQLSSWTQNYLKPAGTMFWGFPAATLAVSGLKVWWHSLNMGKKNKIPGYLWEELVIHVTRDLLNEAECDQDTCTIKSGLAYFLQTMTIFKLSYNAEDPQQTTYWWRGKVEAANVVFEWTPARENILHRVCKAARDALQSWEIEHDLCKAFGFPHAERP